MAKLDKNDEKNMLEKKKALEWNKEITKEFRK